MTHTTSSRDTVVRISTYLVALKVPSSLPSMCTIHHLEYDIYSPSYSHCSGQYIPGTNKWGLIVKPARAQRDDVTDGCLVINVILHSYNQDELFPLSTPALSILGILPCKYTNVLGPRPLLELDINLFSFQDTYINSATLPHHWYERTSTPRQRYLRNILVVVVVASMHILKWRIGIDRMKFACSPPRGFLN